jgi:hypothetical protein
LVFEANKALVRSTHRGEDWLKIRDWLSAGLSCFAARELFPDVARTFIDSGSYNDWRQGAPKETGAEKWTAQLSVLWL